MNSCAIRFLVASELVKRKGGGMTYEGRVVNIKEDYTLYDKGIFIDVLTEQFCVAGVYYGKDADIRIGDVVIITVEKKNKEAS